MSAFYYNVNGHRLHLVELEPGAEIPEERLEAMREELAVGHELIAALGRGPERDSEAAVGVEDD